MTSPQRTHSALGVVENGVDDVHLEPVDEVERGVVDGPVEDLVHLEEEGNVAVELGVRARRARTKNMQRLGMEKVRLMLSEM